MEQTGIQSGSPPGTTASTAIQAGPPDTSAVGTPSRSPKSVKHPALVLLERIASLRITVVLFALSILLVFWGTLAQVDNGVWTVVAKYFRSFYVSIPLKVVLFNATEAKGLWLPYPGGLLIGSVMLLNLLAAHAIRFRFAWNRAGIILIHAGIIVMMLSEVITHLYAEENNMMIQVGRTINYVFDQRNAELAIIRTIDDKKDEAITIPASMMRTGAKIADSKLPFEMEVVEYMSNSVVLKPHVKVDNRATKGLGPMQPIKKIPEVSGVDPEQKTDIPSAFIRVTKDGKDLGVWLFSVYFSEPYFHRIQEITVDNKTYQVVMRYKQTQRDFSLTLTKFKHDVHPHTNIPKDYRSYIRLIDTERRVDFERQIYMNAPMTYAGETFYQAAVHTDSMGTTTTTLQVVRNPGWLMPYISCAVVGFGLLIHFGLTLYRFIDRRTVR